MKDLKEVNKVLGENVETTARMFYTSNKNRDLTGWYAMAKKVFCNYLKAKGYDVRTSGNYVVATSNNETNTFFFAAHDKKNTNYLIPRVLKNQVQYFAFYDEHLDKVNIVAYNKVREFAKTITKAVYFGSNGEAKLRIPDSWAKQQTLNIADMKAFF